MDGDPQRLRTHDFTVLATLGLTALYSDIGLRLEEERAAYRLPSNDADRLENGSQIFSSPQTPHSQSRRSNRRRSQIFGADGGDGDGGDGDGDGGGGGGGNSSAGNVENRKRKSIFEGNPESSGTVVLPTDIAYESLYLQSPSTASERRRHMGMASLNGYSHISSLKKQSKSRNSSRTPLARAGESTAMKSAFARVQRRSHEDQLEPNGKFGLRNKRAGRQKPGEPDAGFGIDANGSSSAVEPRPREYGEIWFNRYLILAKLGEGAFSQAFLAADILCNRMGRRHDGTRLVTVKRVGAQEIAIGMADYQMISTLNALDTHGRVPIVRIYDIFAHRAEREMQACLVMEPLLGGTLHDAFPKRVKTLYSSYDAVVARKMHMDMIRTVIKQLLAALAHMHSNSLIHADIKPTNVICVDSQSLRIKLIDFGNAVSDSDVSEYFETFVIQTVWFRAPEVAYQRPFGRAIDIWSVGCVMCELWLGRSLFSGMDNRGLIQSMLKLRGPPPASLYIASPMYGETMRLWSSGRPKAAPGFAPAVVRGRLRGAHSLGIGIGTAEQSLDWDAQLRMSWLKHSLHVDDDDFVSLADALLDYDPELRPTAVEALQHPFFDGMY
ncbi:hypothetical protein LPJ64_004380 [Coemansia asiatica]|uniref:Protein kinase domain-containing protein n=1 Tax=Coemansia asiatica TaxID=1052880 RepID=A0A9W8CIM5_9FUNG|nr:hypothetical protein LPJ64_004380 [Coemansia asiatica]